MRGIYIHIPFCVQKCNYCNFVSYKMNDENAKQYIKALEGEIKKTYANDKADTVYIGGGTPTVLGEELLESLFKCIKKNINISPDCEFTVEANPKTVTADKCNIMKEYGVNRISLGAQSFNDGELKFLGRIHTAYDTEYTYNLLRQKGFNNINLDLMFGLPCSNAQTLKTSIKKYISLNPEHISCYGLTAEHGTAYKKAIESKRIKELGEDDFAEIYNIVCKSLKDGGYMQYELSNFARDGFESKHNIKYWTQCEYYGFGAAAAGFLDGIRYVNTAKVREYTDCAVQGLDIPKSERYKMSKDEQMSEFVVLGLRLTQTGADKKLFYKKFGVFTDDVFGDVIEKYTRLGFMDSTDGRIVLKPNAYYVSNAILCDFM